MAWVLLVMLWLVPYLSHAGVSFPSSARVGSVGNIAIQCGDSEILKFSGGSWACSPDASGGASGALLDLGDLGTNQSLSIAEIATTGDTNNIFTESAADKLRINVALPWPKADALTNNGGNCAAGQAPLGVNTLGAVENCFDVGTQVELDVVADALADHITAWNISLLLDLGDNAANESTRISEIATSGDTNSIFTMPLVDKLLINAALPWPKADALTLNGGNCSAGFAPLGVDTFGAVEGCYNIATQAELDAALAGSGASLVLGGVTQSTSIGEIAVVDDTHAVFSEPSPDNLLITVSNAWPKATALAVNGDNCAAGTAPLGVDTLGAVENCFDVATQAELDASTAGSGSILDLGDDGGNDSSSIGEIAVTGDTHGVFTMPLADKLLINVANAWPLATALSTNKANCAAGTVPLGVDASGGVEGCYDVATQTELGAHIANVFSCVSGICTVADAQELDMSGVSVTGVGEGLRLPGHATDCSTAGTEEGQVCWEADSDTLWIGNATGVTQIGAGGGAGTITDVLGCTGPDCSSITIPDGALLSFASVDSNLPTEGLILPQSESCETVSAMGQICFDTNDNVMRVATDEDDLVFYPFGDVGSIFDCESGDCAGVLTLSVNDGINFSLTDPNGAGGLIFPTTTDCSGVTNEGTACWDSDNDTLHVGTSAGIVSFGPGSAGDIESVFGCMSGACTSIAVADTQLLSFAAVSVSSTTEGLILPGHATDCSAAGTAEGQMCWEADSNTLWVGTSGGVVNISGTGVTLDQAFDNGKIINGANSRANAVFIGDANGDGTLHFTGTLGPTQECVTGYGGVEGTCDLRFNAAAGDAIYLQQAGSTFMAVDDGGVIIDLPTGDVFVVDINNNIYQTISETGVAFSIPAGDTFTANTPSFIIGNSAGTACLTLNTATGAVTQGTNCANLNFSGSTTSKIRHTDNASTPVTLTGADCLGAIHKSTSGTTVAFTLCDGVTGGGQMVCFEARGAGAITVDVNDVAETISLSNGTGIGAGDKVSMAAGVGNGFCMLSDSATAWHILPGAVGALTDGGP